MVDQARQVDEESLRYRNARELVLRISVAARSSPITANQQQKISSDSANLLQVDSRTPTYPTLSGFSSIQLFTVFRAMSAAGSLGKPGKEKNSVNTTCIRHECAEGRQKETGKPTDKPISPRGTALLLNQWKPEQAACLS